MNAWLTGTFIATNALMVLVLVAREPVRRQCGPAAAYALWLIPALRVAMPPLTRTVERIVPPASEGSASLMPVSLAPLSHIQPTLVERLGGWDMILVTIWLGVAAGILTWGVILYRRQRAAVLASAVDLALIGRVRLVRSPDVSGPLAFGLLDPVIAVPTDFDQRFDERQRRLALAHELAHHQAGDLPANLIAYVLLCLQWFNPLAWVAHAAFRFDQEAACDARVLDMVDGPDRAAYGRTIAKAASGRALLFAGALDRPNTLPRRLKSMLIISNPRRRLAGKLMVIAGIAAALPLTASRATQFVDRVVPVRPVVPAREVVPVRLPVAPVALVAAQVAVLPVPIVAPTMPVLAVPAKAPRSSGPQPDISFIGEDTVRIHGQTKRWGELTPAERAEIRAETTKARGQLNRELARLPEQMANARREAEQFRNGEFRRQMADARVDMRRALAQLDANAAILRANGQDPEKLKAQVRASLNDVETMDIDKVVRESLASVNPDKIAAELRHAQESLARIETRLDQLDRRP